MPTRRHILTGAAVTAAAALLPTAIPAVAENTSPAQGAAKKETIRTPTTMATRTRAGRAPVSVTQPMDFVGLRFDDDVPAAGAIRFHTGDSAGPWQALELSGHGRDNKPVGVATELLRAAPGTTSYELKLPGGVDSTEVVAINTTAGPIRSRYAIPSVALPGYKTAPGTRFYSRAGWGADESMRFSDDGTNLFPEEFYPVQILTVHHTSTDPGPDRMAVIRALYQYEVVEREFGDMGYHVFIDPEGNAYEGRHSGEELFPIFDGVPIRIKSPKAVTAAHVKGVNSGNVGICLLGDFTNKNPTTAALETLVRMLTALCSVCDLDPLASVTYVNPVDGYTRHNTPTIARHRDVALNSTECPGNTFAPQFSAIPQRVAQRLNG
ncbi:MAG: peptidoglycan recognition protein family protein [Mycobacteriales bacterium]